LSRPNDRQPNPSIGTAGAMNSPREREPPTDEATTATPLDIDIDFDFDTIVATRDYSKLRKAASSQSLSKLRKEVLLGGWTAQEIDDNDAYNNSKGQQKQRQHASKSALHMAAWKGCLDNVKYLIEDIGCDINAYSNQEFSYGKSAIFFALTQSRPDITEYLLKMGAKVTIVNNKGQSVLSMAATRFENFPEIDNNKIVQTIQKLEEEQGDWWNFRASRSDGFEYGDLDPRFFVERPLKDTDVVTPLAINPTSHQTRKGGFLRRNPDAPKWNNACRRHWDTTPTTTPKQSKKKRSTREKKNAAAQHALLSPEEQSRLDRAWETLLATPLSSTSSETFDRESLLEILTLSDKQRSSWIPQAIARLTERFGTEDSIRMTEKAMCHHPDSPSQRQVQLLEKIIGRLRTGGDDHLQEQQIQQHNGDESSQPHENIPEDDPRSNDSFDSSELWKEARQEIKDIFISCLEETADSPILALPKSPVFVDTPDALRGVLEELSNARLVGIDTEWHTPPLHFDTSADGNANTDGAKAKPKAAVSTLQIAFWNREQHWSLSTYVVDLMQESSAYSFPDYCQLVRTLVKNLLEACSCCDDNGKNPECLPIVMGFAIRHDLPMLENVFEANSGDDDDTNDCNVERESTTKRTPPNYSRVLDLQSVCVAANEEMQRTNCRRSNLPGLKACVARYSSLPLSKDCQCSDWANRPLSKAQLDYAGLDAAILLVLLAERSREEETHQLH
jgi:hypothetical protein